jgi:hypothetical protein
MSSSSTAAEMEAAHGRIMGHKDDKSGPKMGDKPAMSAAVKIKVIAQTASVS